MPEGHSGRDWAGDKNFCKELLSLYTTYSGPTCSPAAEGCEDPSILKVILVFSTRWCMLCEWVYLSEFTFRNVSPNCLFTQTPPSAIHDDEDVDQDLYED